MSGENDRGDLITSTVGCGFAFFASPFVMFYNAFWAGLVLLAFWDWFITPLFEQAPALTLPYAMGLAVILSYLTYHIVDSPPPKHDAVTIVLTRSFVNTLTAGLAWLVGWVIFQLI